MSVIKSKYVQLDVEGKKFRLDITDNPIREKVLETKQKVGEMTVFFFLDKFKYLRDVETVFETDFYTLQHLSKDKDDEYFYHYVHRLFALHSLVLNTILPFWAIMNLRTGEKTGRRISFGLLGDAGFNEFGLYYEKDNWTNLTNDFKILNDNIKFGTEFEKSLVWFYLAKLSGTNSERFMNYFRCVESFSRASKNVVIINEDAKLLQIRKILQKTKSDKEKITDINKILEEKTLSNTQQIKNVLNNIGFDKEFVDKIIKFRNNVDHGHSFSVELNPKIRDTNAKMAEMLHLHIMKQIKQLRLIGLKNKHFRPNYRAGRNAETKEIEIVDFDNLTPERFQKYDYNSDIMGFSRSKLTELMKKSKMEDAEIKYVLYYYDLEVNEKGITKFDDEITN